MSNVLQEHKLDHQYLGDGVYIFHDGFHIVLYTVCPSGEEKYIYLEPDVFAQVSRYVRTTNISGG